MPFTYRESVYIKQQLGPKRLQQGFLNSIKVYYDNQNKNVKCINNDNEVYIYLSAMFHNTEVKGSNISVLTKDTDLEDDMEYGNPTKLFEALFSNRAFLRWKKNSFDLSIDQNMMPIMDNRFLQLQNDTETVIRLIKRTDTGMMMRSKTKKALGTAFSLNLKLNDVLDSNGSVEESEDNLIRISEASKYFFVTTTQNKRNKPLEININNTRHCLASAVIATSVDLYEKAGGHYIALWLHKSLQKALSLDSNEPDGKRTAEITNLAQIQMNLQRAVILVYAQPEYIDYGSYDKQFKLLKQNTNLCFVNSGLNALRYILAFHENIQETFETEFNDFDQLEEKRILEFSMGNYVELNNPNNVNEYINGLKQKVNQGNLTNVVDILRPEITESVNQNKIISHFTIDKFGLRFEDLFNHLLGNVYLKQTIIEHYINVIKYARSSFNPIDKNIIIFELLFVQDIDNKKVLAYNHYNILKHYSHLIKIKTSSTFNDVINIPLEGAFSHGVYSSSYMLENVEKNVFRRRSQDKQLIFFYDSIEFDLNKLKSILIPVSDRSNKNHFWLYHIFFEKSRKKRLGYIHCYNKNYGEGEKFQDDHNRYLKIIKEWLQQKLPLVTEWREKQLLDIQKNNVACGVYVCQFIREIVKNDLNLDQIGKKLSSDHIENCRKLMFVELLENCILDY